MRATFKTIKFDFSFNAPDGRGQYVDADTITVCEPGFDSRGVFRRMGGFVSEAQKGIVQYFSAKPKAEIEAEVQSAADSDVEPDPLALMRMGLSTDDYEKFMQFAERSLTGNRALAYIGDVDAKIPVTEEAWRNLVEAGGLEQMDRVIGEFTSFFFATPAAPASTTQTGTAKPSSSRAPATAASRTTKH